VPCLPIRLSFTYYSQADCQSVSPWNGVLAGVWGLGGGVGMDMELKTKKKKKKKNILKKKKKIKKNKKN